jgi:tRNA modification GTPase
VSQVRDDLRGAAAGLAATIDFAEDVGETVPAGTRAQMEGAVAALARLGASFETGRLLSSGCRVAILGRPNAGKSTLFNALLGSARAIVTDVPGTTRDTLHATVDIEGIPVELVDTAGLRETEDAVEKIGVLRAREAGETADFVLYVFDAGGGWSGEDAAALAELDGKPIVVIANKSDTLAGGFSAGAPAGARPLCGISPEAGPTLDRLLADALARGVSTDRVSEVLGSLRQRDCVDRARAAASDALASLDRGDSPEYAATHLHAAMDALADLAGETTPEDVLRELFSTFCIGK